MLILSVYKELMVYKIPNQSIKGDERKKPWEIFSTKGKKRSQINMKRSLLKSKVEGTNQINLLKHEKP